jgi:hypothetical protein
MNRTQLLQLLIGQARTRGFEFRRWYVAQCGIPWSGADHAVEWLARGQRARMLVFSHDFARAFFRSGDRITFVVPPQSFQRVTPGGGVQTVERPSHLRKSSRTNVWQYHLKEMVAAEEPLRYIRRFLLIEETIAEITAAAEDLADEASYDDENLVRDAG